ncbi:VOC family protein [Actinomadura nitritigenes]|uniref:VOC family protein n=1 Tax=Actinomadura nitritigenes TaxID=134602 RepID=A0ABS3R1Y2_9ACTN|nr:VOC family protein [Actinomadura nitritigenes]MBO2440191.1 VOC family protein [Actinomadura nitritigenes]
MGKVSTCLWFDGQAEEAARFYTSVVKNSRVTGVVPYGEAGPGEPGSVMIVMFELDGQQFVGLNGGPQFTFDEAVSVHVTCDSQEEIDELWTALTADGGEEGPCGWLKDKYGLSWQIDSRALHEMIVSPDQEAAARATKAMFTMKKLDVQALQDAFDGKS